MLRRLFPCLALLCLIAAPVGGRAVDAATPDVVVRLQSIDVLLGHMKHIGGLAGQDEKVKQFEPMLTAMAGGIDTKLPLGLYGTITASAPEGLILLIPVSDEKALLASLAARDIKAVKGADDVYVIKELPVPVHFRFANKYVYIAPINPEHIAKNKLVDPGKLLTLDPATVVSAAVRIDKIPNDLKQLAIQRIDLAFANAKSKKEPGDTDEQHKLKGQALDGVSASLSALVKDSGEFTVRINIDRKTNELAVELGLTGKPGSGLATSIANLGQAKSALSGLATTGAAANFQARLTLPEDVRKPLAGYIEEQVRKDLAKERDPAQRDRLTKLFKALDAEIKGFGDMELAVDLRGPADNKLYTAVVGQNLKDGKAFELAMRDFVRTLPAEMQALIKTDADKAGAIPIHQIDVQKVAGPEFQRIFGDNPVYIAIRPDAMMAGAGDKGLVALKEALTAQPQAATPLRLNVSVARLAPMFKELPDSVRQMLAKEKDADKIRLTLEGGQTLKLRFDMNLMLVKLIGEKAAGQKFKVD